MTNANSVAWAAMRQRDVVVGFGGGLGLFFLLLLSLQEVRRFLLFDLLLLLLGEELVLCAAQTFDLLLPGCEQNRVLGLLLLSPDLVLCLLLKTAPNRIE